MFDIITVGAATRDILIKDEHFQEIKESELKIPRDLSPTDMGGVLPLGLKIEVRDVTIDSGGGATNAAVTFARQGFSVACVSSIGDDAEGKEIEKQLQSEGITTFFQKGSQRTAFSVILIARGGERSILNFRGASEEIKAHAIPWQDLQTRWFYLSSLAGDHDLLEQIFTFAKKRNILIAFNPGARELGRGLEQLKAFFARLDILIMNNEEAALLTGLKNEKDFFYAFTGISDRLVTVITKGPSGVNACDGTTIYQAGTFQEKARVDRTGAGDAFGSGFLAGFIRGGIQEGIRVGSANSTSKLEHMGAKGGLLTKESSDYPRWQNFEITSYPL